MSTLNQAQFKILAKTYDEASEDLHAFALPHVQRYLDYQNVKNSRTIWADEDTLPEAYRFESIEADYAVFSEEYDTLMIPLRFFDNHEAFFAEAEKENEERARRKSLEAVDVRRKRIEELQRLLAEDAAPEAIDIELTRKYT